MTNRTTNKFCTQLASDDRSSEKERAQEPQLRRNFGFSRRRGLIQSSVFEERPASFHPTAKLMLPTSPKTFVHPHKVYRLEYPAHWEQVIQKEGESCGFGPHD